MPICSVGQILPIKVDVKILRMFAHEDRIYYIAQPIKSLLKTFWIVTNDGIPLDINNISPEVLAKAYRVIGVK